MGLIKIQVLSAGTDVSNQDKSQEMEVGLAAEDGELIDDGRSATED